MPMSRDDHEKILVELNNPELEHSKRVEYLQNLRLDYNTVLTDDEKQRAELAELSKEKNDLVLSNSKLFRQLKVEDNTDNKQEEKKTFSQTVTIEKLIGE